MSDQSKVLFLDIDGVLNKDKTHEKMQLFEEVFDGVSHDLVCRYYNWRKDKNDLKVVLSSTWRHSGQAMDYLNQKGIFWDDITPTMGHRGLDIDTWLLKHPEVTHVAILDDLSDLKPVGRYLVQTSFIHGLQDKHLRKLDKLLGYDKAPHNQTRTSEDK